jgi:predicted nucleic acid-binding protein
MAEVRELKLWHELSDHEIVLDTNILLYRYWHERDRRLWIILYRNKVDLMYRNGYRLSVDLLVIGECISVTSREAQRELEKRNPHLYYKDYKSFRDSPEGIVVMTKIYATVRNELLVECQLINTILTNVEVQSICYAEPLDFVDKILLLLCRKRNAVLFTNDGDFRSRGIDILTSSTQFFDTCEAVSSVKGVSSVE